MIRYLIGLFAALLFSAAIAQPVPSTDPIPRVVFPVTTVGNVSTIGPRTADAANAAKFSFGAASNGAVFASTNTNVPTPGGASIPVSVTGTIAKPSVAAAVGRFARKALPFISTGAALYDLFEELGLGVAGGSITRPEAEKLGYSDAWEYALTPGDPWTHDYQTPCNQLIAAMRAADPSSSYSNVTSIGGGGIYCNFTRTELSDGSVYPNSAAIARRPQESSPPPLGTEQVSDQQFVEIINDRNSWPSSSALPRVTVEAIKAGESLAVEPFVVSGPSTSPGATSEQVDPTTTTTTSAVNNHSYVDNSVVTTVTTTTTVRNNSTGDVISTSVRTDSPVIPSQGSAPGADPAAPLCGVPGTPPCSVKVDETGTPPEGTATARFGQAVIDLDAVKNDANSAFDAHKEVSLPDWSWTFALPSGCTPLVLAAYDGLEIDVCQWQPMIHDLMSMLWVAAGVFGLIALFRNATGI